ncbi:MAG: hypothetical protein ACNS61_03665 [Candidatus Wenzhouxiangella sp. M2_3B_020]
MKSNRFSAFTGFALVAIFTLGTASAQDNEPLPFADSDEESGMVVGTVGQPAQYIYPVEFIEIDDRNIHPREVMWLTPGEYELTVRGFVKNPPGLRSAGKFRQDEGYNTITLVVEAGKKYSVGMKYDTSEPMSPYHTVVYRVEDR